MDRPAHGHRHRHGHGHRHVWITEDIYDKEYVRDRTIGFDEFKKYVLGETDGVPKTPEWAEEESGVEGPGDPRPGPRVGGQADGPVRRLPGRRRRRLPPGLRHRMGPHDGTCCRPCRAWALRAGASGAPPWARPSTIPLPGSRPTPTRRAISTANIARIHADQPTKQRLWRLTLPEAILNPPVSWYGEGFCGQSLEQQFKHFDLSHGGVFRIKLWYRYGGSFMGTMSDTTKWVRMYQSPKLEFVVNQDIWFNSETRMADVILPACTNFERDDVGEWAACGGYTVHASSGCNYRVVVRAAEVHRAPVGIQVGLRDLHPAWPSAWA
jgi:anaerobic selenocysteine-containing dehydrogenase